MARLRIIDGGTGDEPPLQEDPTVWVQIRCWKCGLSACEGIQNYVQTGDTPDPAWFRSTDESFAIPAEGEEFTCPYDGEPLARMRRNPVMLGDSTLQYWDYLVTIPAAG